MPETRRSSFRFSPRTLAIAQAIAEARGGLTITKVFENALEEHAKKILGRRLNDLIPVELRRPQD